MFYSGYYFVFFFFFFNDTATTEIYTLSLHDALPIRTLRPRRARSSSPPFSALHAHAEPDLNGAAVSATTHCLTGCAIGEVLGMAIATAFSWGNAVQIVLAIVLAFVFGYALTLQPVLRAGVGFRRASGIAFAADTLSIAIKEAVDNGFVLVVPG